MSERLSFSLGVVIACLIAIATISFSIHASAAVVGCPTGTQPAVASDAAVQNGTIPVGTCYNPNAVGINQTSQAAKQDLAGMVCGGGANVQNLDANFAVCADKFMKALRQVTPGACISSAYRNPQQQLAACQSICGASSCPGTCAAPGASFHQRGLAIDVSGITNNQQAWQIATQSTGGGIANPSGLHSSDPHHFQATTISCAGAPVPTSDTTDVYTGTQTAPSGVAQPTSSPVTTSAQPVTQATPTTQPATIPTQQTAATTPTITPTSPLTTTIATSSANSILSNLFQTTPLSLLPTATSATQAINIITNLGNTSSASTSLDQNLQNIVMDLIPGNQQTVLQTNTSSDTSQTSYPQDTFSSGGYQQYVPSSTSGIDQFLQPLKNILLSLLSYLQSL